MGWDGMLQPLLGEWREVGICSDFKGNPVSVSLKINFSLL